MKKDKKAIVENQKNSILNRGISTPIGILIIVLVAIIAGGIMVWQSGWLLEEGISPIHRDGKSSTVAKIGRIVVIGNEPFAMLSLQVEDEKNYLLGGSLEKELWDFQNNTVIIEGNLVEEHTINVISYSLFEEKPKAALKECCKDLLDKINEKIEKLDKNCLTDKDCVVMELFSENRFGGVDLICINKKESAEWIRNLQELRHQKCEEFMPAIMINPLTFYGCKCENNSCFEKYTE